MTFDTLMTLDDEPTTMLKTETSGVLPIEQSKSIRVADSNDTLPEEQRKMKIMASAPRSSEKAKRNSLSIEFLTTEYLPPVSDSSFFSIGTA